MTASDYSGSDIIDKSLLHAIAAGTAHHIGLDFLDSLVVALRDSMKTSLAFLTIGLGKPPTRARSICAWQDENQIENFEYDLKETPCELVYQGQRIVIPCDLEVRFPKEASFQGYVGVPLRDRDDVVSGHLAVLSREPIEDQENAENVVRIFGIRAEAERRRVSADAEREALIEQLKTLNQRLARRYGAVHQANAFKTKLLAMVAHDLRNPLATVVNQVEWIESQLEGKPDQSEKIQKACETILAGADRMTGLIRHTLQQTQEDSATFDLEKSEVELGHVVRTAASVNQSTASSKGITLTVAAVAEVSALCDEDLILEAVDNLISNAIKYSHANTEVVVAISTTPSHSIITVRDQGQGLTEDDMENMFKPYQVLSAKPTGEEESVGIGLTIVKSIVEAHGGTLDVTSGGKGKGATFVINLLR